MISPLPILNNSAEVIAYDLPYAIQRSRPIGDVQGTETRDPGDYPLRYWSHFQPRRRYFATAAIVMAGLALFTSVATAQVFGPPRIVQGAQPFIGRNAFVGGSAFIGSQVGRYYGGYPGAAAGWVGGRVIGGSMYDSTYSTRYYYPRGMGIQTTTPYMIRPYGR